MRSADHERLVGAVEDAVLVHLVRHGQQVVLDADRRQILEPARRMVAWNLWKTQPRFPAIMMMGLMIDK